MHVSSLGQLSANLEQENFDLNYEDQNKKFYHQFQYYNTKLAQILYSNELARRLRKAGANIESVSLHPGKRTSDITVQ